MKRRNWVWGIFFLCAAVLILANSMGIWPRWYISPFKLAVSVLLIFIIIKSLPRREFFGILIPLAILINIYARPIAFFRISSGALILAAVFASIGLSIMFRKRIPEWSGGRQHGHWHHSQTFSNTVEDIDENVVYCKVSFGEDSKYLHSTNLERAELICSFGDLKVFFDQAIISPNGAEIFIDVSFGAVELFVPRGWQVVDHISATVAGVKIDNRHHNTPEPGMPVLTLTGNAQFAGIDVRFV